LSGALVPNWAVLGSIPWEKKILLFSAILYYLDIRTWNLYLFWEKKHTYQIIAIE
jgi:hypothetical protein